MPKESYTTFGIDLAIAKFLEGIKGHYVDIGCWKPDEYSNTYLMYKNGWKGICIDPNTDFIQSWKDLRPRDTFINYAVGKAGKATYHKYDYSMANTLVESNVFERLNAHKESTEEVKVVPLNEIFSNCPPTELLSVDTEGNDIEVLDTNDWDLYRPLVVVIEDYDFDKTLKIPKVKEYMESKGYMKICDYYSDSIFLEKDFSKRFYNSFQ